MVAFEVTGRFICSHVAISSKEPSGDVSERTLANMTNMNKCVWERLNILSNGSIENKDCNSHDRTLQSSNIIKQLQKSSQQALNPYVQLQLVLIWKLVLTV